MVALKLTIFEVTNLSLALYKVSSWILGISVSFMVKVNNLQLLTGYVLQFAINDKTLHLLFSSYHWECRSGSGHRNEISSGGDGNCQL